MPGPSTPDASRPAAQLRRLLPPAPAASPLEIADQLELAAEACRTRARPYVILNMISSADGRASIDGRSGPLGDDTDRQLFHALRSVVDAVMAGAGTVRTERYGRLVRDPQLRRLRRERGRSEEPLACVVTGRLALPADLPLLSEPAAHVAIITPSQASLPESPARVDYVRAQHDGALDLAAALAQLRERFSVHVLLCEGGPHLNAHLLAAGLVDELFLTISPKLAGDPSSGESLRIVAGPAFERPIELRLRAVLEGGSQLFLRYGVGA